MQTASDPSPAPLPVAAQPPSVTTEGRKRAYIVSVVSASHVLTHIQLGASGILLPLMMRELGFDVFQLGLLSSFSQLAGSAMQVIYGLIAQYYRRSVLLGVGNIVLGVCLSAVALSQSFLHVLALRAAASLGSSAQHPLGAAILAINFPRSKGQMLAIHHAVANVGSLVAPLLVVALLGFLDWRPIWVVVGVPMVLIGFAYFFFGDATSGPGGSTKARTKVAFGNYLACLRNRDVMVVSAIQMVGAAGRGSDINTAFLVLFFGEWLGVDITVAGILLAILQLGSVGGPVAIGWLSDRTSRRLAIFAVLLLSTVSTIALLLHSQVSAVLVLNLLVYGAVVNSRESLTQSMISDAVSAVHADAAFSLYYFIGFISGPIWTALTGYLVYTAGFAWAFVVVGLTYLNGIALIGLLSPKPK
ncbi:MAG: MFS transporter [Chloroflexi bacterium]|nr:MFS transporter [Chloroflexota bacterium]